MLSIKEASEFLGNFQMFIQTLVNYSLHLQASLLKWGLFFSTPFVTTEVAKQFTRWWDTQTTSDHTIPKASWASYLPVDRLKVLRRKRVSCDNSILLSNGQSRWRYEILVFKVRQQGLTVHREAHTSSHLCILSAVCFICLRMRRTFLQYYYNTKYTKIYM